MWWKVAADSLVTLDHRRVVAPYGAPYGARKLKSGARYNGPYGPPYAAPNGVVPNNFDVVPGNSDVVPGNSVARYDENLRLKHDGA